MVYGPESRVELPVVAGVLFSRAQVIRASKYTCNASRAMDSLGSTCRLECEYGWRIPAPSRGRSWIPPRQSHILQPMNHCSTAPVPCARCLSQSEPCARECLRFCPCRTVVGAGQLAGWPATRAEISATRRPLSHAGLWPQNRTWGQSGSAWHARPREQGQRACCIPAAARADDYRRLIWARVQSAGTARKLALPTVFGIGASAVAQRTGPDPKIRAEGAGPSGPHIRMTAQPHAAVWRNSR